MDLSTFGLTKSDQINADDLLSGPVTVTIAGAFKDSEGRLSLETLEFPGKAWKPPVSVVKILKVLWGHTDTDEWLGKKATIYHDPDVVWGGKKIGGVRVSHMTHIDSRRPISVNESRGKKAVIVVEPLDEPTVTLEDVRTCEDVNTLREMWKHAVPAIQEAIQERVTHLGASQEKDTK